MDVLIHHTALVVVSLLWLITVSRALSGIGTEVEENSGFDTVDDDRSFYLNTLDPANVSGIVSSLWICYELDDRSRFADSVFTATIGFYRPKSNDRGSFNYSLISNTTLTRSRMTIPEGPFQCENVTIPDTEVEEDDVIGVCARDFNSSFRRINSILDVNRGDCSLILGRESDSSDCFLMGEDSGNNDFCPSVGSVPASFTSSDLRRVSRRVMRIFAPIIIFTPTTTAMTTPVTNSTGEPLTTIPSQTESSSIDSRHLTIGLVISGVVIIVAVVLCCCICACLLAKRRVKGKVSMAVTGPLDMSQSLLDNDNYINTGYRIPISTTNQAQVHYSQEPISISTHFDEGSYVSPKPTSSYAIESLHSLDSPLYEVLPNNILDSYAEPCETLRKYSLAGPDTTHNYENTPTFFFNLLETNQEEDIYRNLTPYSIPASQEMDLYKQLKNTGIKNIKRNRLESVGHLGSGQFGTVDKGIWHWGGIATGVALKTLKSVNELDKILFLQEAVLMAQFKHPNIICLYGVVSVGEPVILVMEYASRGDLRHILKAMCADPGEPVPSGLRDTLLIYSQQIALGMQYLSSRHFIHRDLAARNILVTSKNICKIADFGMCRDLENDDYYFSQGGKIPVKWTAPEAIQYKKYSTASDVWSYGCVLYEIWSVGRVPFANMSNQQVLKLVTAGRRQSPPPGCPQKIYQIMLLCWDMRPAARPTFRGISKTLMEHRILHIPAAELKTHPQAGMLGAPLQAGAKLYATQQEIYSNIAAKQT